MKGLFIKIFFNYISLIVAVLVAIIFKYKGINFLAVLSFLLGLFGCVFSPFFFEFMLLAAISGIAALVHIKVNKIKREKLSMVLAITGIIIGFLRILILFFLGK
ncbi:hypothetical protein J7K24_00665 [bacterium]|nr:hypothetical protein [bacterium]